MNIELSPSQPNKKINNSLNVLKCLAIFAVICIHCKLNGIGGKSAIVNALSRFAVPVFFLIAGYFSFYEKKNYAIDKYKARIIRLFKLLVFSNLLYFIYKCITTVHFNIQEYLISFLSYKNLFNIIIFDSTIIGRHLWFIQALLYCYIIIYLLKKYDFEIKKLYVYIPILLLMSIMIGEFSNLMGFHIDKIITRNFMFTGMPFFILGYLIKDKQDKFTSFSDRFIITPIILGGLLTILERIVSGDIELYIGQIFVSIMLFIWCIKYPNKLNFKILGFIGGEIYMLMYVLHIIVLDNVYRIFHNNLTYMEPFLVFILTAIVSTILYFTYKYLKIVHEKFIKPKIN